MFIMTPEVVRTVHEDRRRQLLREAEVRRVRREIKAARRAERAVGGSGGRLRLLTRRDVRHHDAKVARLAASWLQLDHRTARLLARVADEVELPAGTVLCPGRFSYIGLGDAHRGLVVTTGTPPVTLESAAAVLVLTTGDLEHIGHAVPHLASLCPDPVSAHDEATTAAPCPVEPPRSRVGRDPADPVHDAPVARFPRAPAAVAASG